MRDKAALTQACSGTQNFAGQAAGVMTLDQDGFTIDDDSVVAAGAKDESSGSGRKVANHGNGFDAKFLMSEDDDVSGFADFENSTIIETMQSSWF